MKAVDGLLVALETAYPREVREKPAEFLDYNDAKRYLQTLVMQVARTIKSSDRSIFRSENRFQGKTLMDLIRYMYQNGLLFAKNPEGGEGVYDTLFLEMRNLYVVLGSATSAAGSAGKQAPAAEKP